jgi:hypothetical protein
MKKLFSLTLAIIAILSMTMSVSATSTTIYSDTSLTVYGPLNAYAPLGDSAWGSSQPAVLTWVHPAWPSHNPAKWISNTYLIEGNVSGDTWRLFRKTVNLCEGAYNISGTVTANSDNAEEVYVNGVFRGHDGPVTGPGDGGYYWQTFVDYPYTATGDQLVFDFIVRNFAGSSEPMVNPTGLIFSATINYSCPVEVEIDIKPGSFPSCFNNDGHGLIPVVVFGSDSFDVRDINLSTVYLETLPVATKPNGQFMAAYQDWDLDGHEDLLVKFVDEDGVFTPGDYVATLTGNLMDGTPFFGMGDICITQ